MAQPKPSPAAAGHRKRKSAYDEGYVASEQAYPRESNPYQVWTAAHEWWDAGWSQALDDLCGEGR
jgi:ribosome modulation factor